MNDQFAVTGTRQREPEPVLLTAGPLSAELVNGNLRTIRYDGTEVLRAIAYVVRDRDWGTYEPAIAGFRQDGDEERFSLGYEAACVGPDGATLRYTASIEGSVDGLTFSVTATPESDFETNRCGFCILHPIVGLAGSPVSVKHIDGSTVETILPELIDPWQPFKDMRAITHTVRPGLRAECRMEGDAFEMEDQRNWSDASYKTYVRPLDLPWPYVLPAGAAQTQTIRLRFSGSAAPVAASGRTVLRPRRSGAGPALPAIGVIAYPDDAEAVVASADLLRELSPQSMLLHFDPKAGHGPTEMAALARMRNLHGGPATLEFAVPCERVLDAEMADLAAMMRNADLAVESLVVSPSVDRRSTPPGIAWPACPPLEDVYTAARRAFPDIRLGGGMLSYFTELNRKRVPSAALDFVTHCTCPIVHAADDLSVMQSLEALTPITQSARAIVRNLPYRIGPSTIAMRQNPYGSATKDNPGLVRVPMANRDPRHNALFGAAWAVGYAARVAPAGLEQLVLSAVSGDFGLIAGAGEPVEAGGRRPLFHVVQALAALAGRQSVAVDIAEPTKLAVVAVSSPGAGVTGLAANLTAEPLDVDLSDLVAEGASLALLDAASMVTDEGWRSISAKKAALKLPPYAVVRFS